jgi:hypothetical protein
VAILPFLEQSALYDEYRLTEPWDSEHNKKLLEQMPALFRSPTAPAGTTSAAYYVLVGEETVFPPEGKGVKISEIADGTSSTVLIVEAKRDTPWTKPEDIAYSSDEPLAQLGGFVEGKFAAAMADGSVHQMDQDMDPVNLRRMMEKTDGLPVKRP